MEALRPRVPFVGWPKQWVDPVYGFVWVVSPRAGAPAAIVSQTICDRGTVESVHRLHDVLDEIVALGFLAQNQGTLIIHDWRALRALDRLARDAWLKRSHRPNNPYATTSAAYAAVTMGGFARMTLQAGALTLQLATGQAGVKLIADPVEALEAHGIGPPSPSYLASLRAAT